MTKLEWINQLSISEAKNVFLHCCGSDRWAEEMAAARPFGDVHSLFSSAEGVWVKMKRSDALQAFSLHPEIGDVASLKSRFSMTQEWAKEEQAGVGGASEVVLSTLARENRKYRDKFGYLFIVCATGMTVEEMLQMLNERLRNDPETEFRVACAEQNKIARVRLEKLLQSPITTHVLDLSIGRPAGGMTVTLEKNEPREGWKLVGEAETDHDGRVGHLLSLPALEIGCYRMTFDTGAYFRRKGHKTFYPSVTITFETQDALEHYHVPLLISPYGYSTYRGS